MADEQGRLSASDLNRCLVEALYEEDEVRLYYPKPIFEGFTSTLGDKNILITQSRQGWKQAHAAYCLARQWQEILENFTNKKNYTLEQQSMIDRKIRKIRDAHKKEFYSKLKAQEDIEEQDLEILQADLLSDVLGFERFTSLYDLLCPIANSSYKLIGKRLIIVHATVDTTKGKTPENSASSIITRLKEQEIIDESIKITHLIPEVGKGRLDGVFGVNHIRLRVAQGDPIDMHGSQLIDPRDIYQGYFDTVNCGRYVATMIGQAVGLLHKEDEEISVKALRASPIVKNAAKFTSDKALQAATKFASEHPIDVGLQENAVERIIEQIRQLNYTYQQRVELGIEYEHLWGSFFGGHSATQKRNVSQQLLDEYQRSNRIATDTADQKIVEQGELGKLYRQLKEAIKIDDSHSDELLRP